MHVIAFLLINLAVGIASKVDGGQNQATVSGIFKTADINKCASSSPDGKCDHLQNKESENKDEVIGKPIFGPKFQKVHLQLPRINPVHTGYVRNISIMKGMKHQMKTLAIYPPVFEIKDFLSSDECQALIYLAKEKGMMQPPPAAKHIGIPTHNSHAAFDIWDQDLDGVLSMDEVSAINEIKHLLLTKNDLKEMYETLGMESDEHGQISYGELEKVSFAKFKGHLDHLSQKKANATVNNTEEAWLWHDEDDLLVYDDVFQDYHERLSNLTRIPQKIIEESEPVQVTKYKNGSFTECRHDSDQLHPDIPCCVYGATSYCRKCRFITVMYFLSDADGGELVLPLADNKTYFWGDLHKDTMKACSKGPNVTASNLVIKPEKGKAIMWYNHYIGRDTGWMSTLNPLSFYGANHVTKGEKWIATTWINILGDGVNELRPWKMGTNWLSENNKKKDIIEAMRNDDFIEGEPYLHDPKLIALDEIEDDAKTRNDELLDNGNDGPLVVYSEDDTNRDIEVVSEVNTPPDNEIKGTVEHKEWDSSKPTDANDIGSETEAYFQTEAGTQTEAGAQKGATSNDASSQRNNEESMKVDVINENNVDSKIVDDAKIAMQRNLKANEESKHDNMKPSGPIINKEEPAKPVTGKSPNRRNRSPEDGEGPLGPPARETKRPYELPSGKMIENKLVMSILMLIEELTRDELEIIARTLHEKLQLACIPIMVNPIGPM